MLSILLFGLLYVTKSLVSCTCTIKLTYHILSIILLEGGSKMKKLLTIALAMMLASGAFICTHVHTEECGEDGINCIHECYHVMPYDDEHSGI